MKKLTLIADYGNDPLSPVEAWTAIQGNLKDYHGAQITVVNSYPSTIHTAFLLNQLVQTEERYGIPHETVFFINTDPRIESTEAVEHAEGAKGLIAKLAGGITIIGPNAGYCFSLIKSKIEKAYFYDGLEKGSQFRSRDLYPRVVAHLMDNMEEELDLQESSLDVIPELRGMFVGHIDNYGNIKTTIKHSDFKGKFEYGDTVNITINNGNQKATYVANLFGGNVGELVIYPGSSGDPSDSYLEISAWSHFGDTKDDKASRTGKDFFSNLLPGMPISIEGLR
ncbi:hypothetical protein A2957_02075 [Candidatus Roizmanbacteria bacterium RIFCSPLOWO2_01_FULL_38_11]|uniref:S-adenosyl-l-methionine hydroxide adenosyltransferase C-terminal domain-containing protein n=1 Tax=Candidatus Roizmanbacteria bacterium RIFCSPLOWO2_01_FULL_38_11 TaxID=1802060 RepID=A0A1F7INU4_9BACT|nr:MAG: hypothetical protein A2957_02075 [Candidatus Roizmanbacteria bacterium RIFCSPLOWO2_01_FULL_38_11]